MAKTVFGMPGVGDEKATGSAEAPKGVSGAKGGISLPQKGEDNSPPKDNVTKDNAPQKDNLASTKHSGSAMAKPAAPAMAKPAAPAIAKPAAPAMAKPVMAAPATPSASEKKGGAAAKTMFGMPAMKLPTAPAATKKESPAADPAPAPGSPSEAPESEDAFKKTMLGAAPVDEGIGDKADTDSENIEEKASAQSDTMEQPAPDNAQEDEPADFSGSRGPIDVSSEQNKNKTLLKIIAIVAAIAIIVIIAVIAMSFSSTDTKEAPKSNEEIQAPLSVPERTGQNLQNGKVDTLFLTKLS